LANPTATYNDSITSYPSPLTDPRDKGYKYILQYIESAWSDGKSYTPTTMFWYGRSRMAEIREYAQGKQSVTKYKKVLLGDGVTDKTSFNVDWNPISFLTKFREIAVSKIIQRDFDIEAFCVDPLAKSEEDAYFNKMKVKIMAREAAEQAGADISQIPALQQQSGEAGDLEQLAMQQKFGYKHQKAMESELGISLIQNQNNFTERRKRVVENLFDFGIGGYKEWIDENGMVKLREVMPENLITSYCLKNNFSDLVHIGEVIFVSVADLAPYFNSEQLDYICREVAGKYGNPNQYPIVNVVGRTWDKFHVAVFDFEFIDFDTTIYQKEIDNRGNLRTYKSDFSNINNPATIEFMVGQAEPRYTDVTRKVVRKGKWLIGAKMMYDYGLSENMKRKQSSWWDTSLSYHLYSWNFQNMSFAGITERLMVLEDSLCLIWYKLQNLRNKLIPYLIKIDLNALEGANFAKSGKKMTPADLVDFMMQEFVVLYRSTDLLSRNPNYDPARIEATGQLQAYKLLYEELQQGLQLMRDVTGLNEITDGSTPNSKNLNSTNAAAIESTNNALYLIMNADKELTNMLSDAIVQRIQVAVKLGKVQGYAKALGQDTVKFFEISPDISNYELGIFVKDAPTYAERQAFIADLNLKDSQGLIDPQDKLIVMSCTNLKQAGELLAYKIQKRKEEQQAFEMQKIQESANGNAMIAEKTEEMKQATIGMQLDADLIRINAEMQWQYEIEQMKKQTDLQGEVYQSDSRNVGHQIQSQAKIIAAHISSEAAKAKQEIANKKPKPKKTA